MKRSTPDTEAKNDNQKETKKESSSYRILLDEVEGIVREISTNETDLDSLVNKIERGYSIIKQMRERLTDTKGRLEKLRMEQDAT